MYPSYLWRAAVKNIKISGANKLNGGDLAEGNFVFKIFVYNAMKVTFVIFFFFDSQYPAVSWGTDSLHGFYSRRHSVFWQVDVVLPSRLIQAENSILQFSERQNKSRTYGLHGLECLQFLKKTNPFSTFPFKRNALFCFCSRTFCCSYSEPEMFSTALASSLWNN